MANEKTARNSSKKHLPMSAAKKEAILKTQGKPAFIGTNCVGGGRKSSDQPSRSARHARKHPNDNQPAQCRAIRLDAQSSPRALFTCSKCGQRFQTISQLDQTLGKVQVYDKDGAIIVIGSVMDKDAFPLMIQQAVLTCHTCRDKAREKGHMAKIRRQRAATAFQGVRLPLDQISTENLPAAHSESRIQAQIAKNEEQKARVRESHRFNLEQSAVKQVFSEECGKHHCNILFGSMTPPWISTR